MEFLIGVQIKPTFLRQCGLSCSCNKPFNYSYPSPSITLISSLLCFLLCIFIDTVWATISVNRVILRTPKDGDIGLIFDINIINTANEEKELLEFRIRPESECSVNLTEDSMMSNAGKIVGGSFGHIEPGSMQTISVVWPTTAIFNRVGFCKIVISSTNVKNEEKEFVQELNFDTRFTKIDSAGSTFRRRPGYTECPNWDMDFLHNCTPVNCEEKYLGRRSFYNSTTKMCEPAPKCVGNEVYDIYSNECLNLAELLSTEDIEELKSGKYDNNTLDLKRSPGKAQEDDRRNPNGEFVPVQAHEPEEPPVMAEILSGLSIVFATILIYTSVCFIIFLFVNWISKASARPPSPNQLHS